MLSTRLEEILGNSSVLRVTAALIRLDVAGSIRLLSESARSAAEAAASLGVEVGQIASSIVFRLPDDSPLLVITSGRHRVNTELVAKALGIEKLHRADAEFVRTWSGYAIGGVSPLGWLQPVTVLIDKALDDYEVVWAAAGHPHAVFPTTYTQLLNATGAQAMTIGD